MALTGVDKDWILPTLAFAQLDQLIVFCHGPIPPAQADWDLWLTHARQRRYTALLIGTLGGDPDARQRAQVANTTRSDGIPRPRTALLTQSTAQRHLVTAFGWLLGDRQPMKAFTVDDVEGALVWLQVQNSPPLVRSTLARLKAALGAEPTGARAQR